MWLNLAGIRGNGRMEKMSEAQAYLKAIRQFRSARKITRIEGRRTLLKIAYNGHGLFKELAARRLRKDDDNKIIPGQRKA